MEENTLKCSTESSFIFISKSQINPVIYNKQFGVFLNLRLLKVVFFSRFPNELQSEGFSSGFADSAVVMSELHFTLKLDR